MTEVREKIVCVWKKMRQGNGEKEGLMLAAYFVWAGGAVDSGGNHITYFETRGLAESSNENLFTLFVCLWSDSVSDLVLSHM